MRYTTTELKELFKDFLIEQYQTLTNKPTLHVVQVGEDRVSSKYVAMKTKLAEDLGCSLKYHQFDNELNIEDLENLVSEIPTSDGLIYQLPIPAKFNTLVENIHPALDVDLLGSRYSELEKGGILPPTIGAIDLVLKHIFQGDGFDISSAISQQMNLQGTKVGVVGQGKLVGTPVVRYLLARNATVISVNIDTVEAHKLIQQCDIVITAAGVENLIDKSWLKDDAIIIDAATSEGKNSIVGDVNLNDIHDNNILCTTPSGVGGITVLYLFWNLFQLRKY
jgi:methylenetetrahydrofolate dehydrogenase (NADP+) / methenyltetrahydrofolate cyclohydrolase